MANFGNELLNGINDLNCNKEVSITLEKILDNELGYYKDKNVTKNSIMDDYKELISNLSKED